MLRSLIGCALSHSRLVPLVRWPLLCSCIQYPYFRLNLPEASKKYEIDAQNIESFLVQLRKFSNDAREKAILFILAQIKKRKLPAEILFNEYFLEQAKKDPHIFIETKLQMLEISVRTLESRILNKEISREQAKQYISLLSKTEMECYPQYFSQISQEQGFIYMFAFNILKRDMTLLFLKHFTEGEERLNNFSTWNYIYEKMVQQIIEDIQIRVQNYDGDVERAEKDELSEEERENMEDLRQEILYFLDAAAGWTLVLDETYQQLYKITKNSQKYIEGMEIIRKYIKSFFQMYSKIGEISDFSIQLLKMKKKIGEIEYVKKKIELGEAISPIEREIVGEEFRITCEELCLQALDRVTTMLNNQEALDLLEKVQKFSQFVMDLRAEQWQELGGYDLANKLTQTKAYILERAPEDIRPQLEEHLDNLINRTAQQATHSDI